MSKRSRTPAKPVADEAVSADSLSRPKAKAPEPEVADAPVPADALADGAKPISEDKPETKPVAAEPAPYADIEAARRVSLTDHEVVAQAKKIATLERRDWREVAEEIEAERTFPRVGDRVVIPHKGSIHGQVISERDGILTVKLDGTRPHPTDPDLLVDKVTISARQCRACMG